MSPLYYIFRPHGIDLSYLEWYFQTTCWHAFMRLNGNSGARSDRFAITDKTFNEMPISTPQDIEEQGKIGTFFKELDRLITLHQRKDFWFKNVGILIETAISAEHSTLKVHFECLYDTLLRGGL